MRSRWSRPSMRSRSSQISLIASLGLIGIVASCVAATRPPARWKPTKAHADALMVTSLAADAAAFWKEAKDKPLDDQLALWDRLVERPHAELYDQVIWETSKHPDAGARKRR